MCLKSNELGNALMSKYKNHRSIKLEKKTMRRKLTFEAVDHDAVDDHNRSAHFELGHLGSFPRNLKKS